MWAKPFTENSCLRISAFGAFRGGGLGALAPKVRKRRIFGHCAPNLVLYLPPSNRLEAEETRAVAVGGGRSGSPGLSAGGAH